MTATTAARRRLLALMLVALSVFTLAPRTSQDLDNGWRATIVADTFQRPRATSTLTLIALPPADVPVRTDLTIRIVGGTWKLAAATPGCSRVGDAVVCVLLGDQVRRQNVITLTVRGAGPLAYTLSTPAPA